MSSFKPGWYEVRFDAKTRERSFRLFKTDSSYIAEVKVDGAGARKLVWRDADGDEGAGNPALWSAEFRRVDKTDLDQEVARSGYQPRVPDDHSRANRVATPRELCQRASNGSLPSGLACSKDIHVGIFFDGTNNNEKRDRPTSNHTNIVSLFDLHKADGDVFFRYYIPGVGTAFDKIGELTESGGGKTFCSGGEARIHYAMIQVYNAVAAAAAGVVLVDDEEAKRLCTSAGDGLATWWRLADGKMVDIFRQIDRRLRTAVEGKRPRVVKVHLSVFGFSRGATQARAFCNWIQKATGLNVGGSELQMKFLGIFDTVASVGLADSGPTGSGFMDWADGDVLDCVGIDRTVHHVAAHEFRLAFPLSTARVGRHYPPNTTEYAYPGAHSDVGGSYGKGSQGKAMGGRQDLLSQITLNDMYFEAINADCALLPLSKVPAAIRADFKVSPALDAAFRAYAAWTTVQEKAPLKSSRRGEGSTENTLEYHTQLYWRWRASVSTDEKFKSLSSYTSASAQDQANLWESEKDWREDVAQAKTSAVPRREVYTGPTARGGIPLAAPRMVVTATPVQKQLNAEVAAAASGVPPEVHDFFDKFVHDSHANFYMLGPTSDWDKGLMLEEIRKKKKIYDSLEAQFASSQSIQRRGLIGLDMAAYRLNNFEKKALEAAARKPGDFPVVTDADVADLREYAGFFAGTVVVRGLIGTATRREPNGHGHYRKIFDNNLMFSGTREAIEDYFSPEAKARRAAAARAEREEAAAAAKLKQQHMEAREYGWTRSR